MSCSTWIFKSLGPFPITIHASIGMNDGNIDRDSIHGVMDGEGSRIEGSSSPLQGIGGPMTRLRAKRMSQALQGLIIELIDEEAIWMKMDSTKLYSCFSINLEESSSDQGSNANQSIGRLRH